MSKHQEVRAQILFTMDTALPAPRALRLLSQENLCEKDNPDEGWEGDVFVFDWMVPSMHAKLQSRAGLQTGEAEGSSEQGHFYCLQDETAREDKAGMQSSSASHCCHLKKQNFCPSIQHYWLPHQSSHQAAQERAMAGSHCATCSPPLCSCSGLHPGCTVHPQAPCSGSEEDGAGSLVLVSTSSWIPISLTLPLLLNGVFLNGSPPSFSGSAGKNAALSNQKHMPFKEQERTPSLAPSLQDTRQQKYRFLLVTTSLLTDNAVWTSVTHSVSQTPLYLLDGFCFTCTSHTSQKKTNPNYLPWTLATHWKGHLMRSHQLAFWVQSAEVWSHLQPGSRCCKQFYYFTTFTLHSLYHTAVILLSTSWCLRVI